MTADPWSQLAGPGRDAAVRKRVQDLSWVALAVSVAGAVLGISGRMDFVDRRAWAGLALLVAGAGLGVGCIRHGLKNSHERGRTIAVVALLVAGLGLAVVGADVVVEIRGPSR